MNLTMKRSGIFISTIASLLLMAAPANAALTAFWDFEGDFVDSVSSTAGTPSGAGATSNGAAISPVGSSSLNLASSTFVEANTAGGLGGTGSFTIFAFIQTSTTADACFFNYSPTTGSGSGQDIRLLVTSAGYLRAEMNNGGGFNLTTAGDLGNGSTHAVAAVFNSSTGNSFLDIDLYVDGTLYNITSGTDHTINLGSGGEVIFGKAHGITNLRHFNGLIDDVSIYDTALSLSELNSLAAGATIPEPSCPMLICISGALFLLRRRRSS